MTFVKLRPRSTFEGLSRRMKEMASDFEKGATFEMGSFNPTIDIIEDGNLLKIYAEMPGMTKENVKISVNEDRIMTINGEKKKEEIEGRTYLREERNFGEFTRSIFVPENFDLDNIKANFENGVLLVSLNKIEPPKPKEIEVNID